MVLAIDMAPEITATRPVASLYSRFHEEEALISSASLGGIVGPLPPRFVEMRPEPCEALFKRLATENPDELLSALDSGVLAPHDLTFAAEAAGDIRDTRRVQVALFALLRHVSPLVREGAIYGLAKLPPTDEVQTALREISQNDASAGVRAAAADVLG